MLILKVSCDVINHLTLEANPDQPAEFPEDILSIYLDSFMTTTDTDDDTELSAGTIAGIVIAVVVVIISVVVAVIAVSIYCHHQRRSGSL